MPRGQGSRGQRLRAGVATSAPQLLGMPLPRDLRVQRALGAAAEGVWGCPPRLGVAVAFADGLRICPH